MIFAKGRDIWAWIAMLCCVPLCANAQNWTQTPAPTNNWSAICGSADLTFLTATTDGGGIYYSTNSGTHWDLSNAPSNSWSAVACSADGTVKFAAVDGGGVWISRDSGATWAESSAISNNWTGLACSADATIIIATAIGGIWESHNSGASWGLTSAPTTDFDGNLAIYAAAACSANGTQLIVVEGGVGASLWLSGDSGATWHEALEDYGWQSPASSASGQILAATPGRVAISTNAGIDWSWTLPDPRVEPGLLALSGPGLKLAFINTNEPTAAFVSANIGETWTSIEAPDEPFSAIFLSEDGNGFIATTSGGGIYKWQPVIPLVASQPQNQTALGASGASLSVGAFSTTPLSYQWEFNGRALAGATNSMLALISVSPSNSGSYSVLVSNSFGAVLSSNAVLAVVPALVSNISSDCGIADAVLSGSVSTGSNATAVWFNWGSDTNYGNSTPPQPVANGLTAAVFSNTITRLNPFTTYHYRAVASNVLGAVYGADAAFTTVPRFLPMTTAPTNIDFSQLAWSSDGTRIAAAGNGFVFTSTNAGVTWTPSSTPVYSAPAEVVAPSIVCSADGATIICAGGSVSVVYRSTNFGATWSSNSTPVQLLGLASSSNAVNLAALGEDGSIYVSTNAGVSWTASGAPNTGWQISITVGWNGLASSADGLTLIADETEYDSYPYTGVGVFRTTNGGISWSGIGGAYPSGGGGAALSADGNRMYVGTFSMLLRWSIPGIESEIAATPGAAPVACSANGAEVFVADYLGGPLWISPNYGTNWFGANTASGGARNIYSTADGSKLAIVTGRIWIGQSASFAPSLSIALAGSNIVLTWPLPVPRFVLQQSTNLASWSAVTNSPQLNPTNLQNQVQLPVTAKQTYFRLKAP
jgi:hypothetical protein